MVDWVVAGVVLDGIDGELATATHPAELVLVRKVLSHPGGMPMLNETVKLKLREWFQSQGGIRVARQSSGTRKNSGGSVYREVSSTSFQSQNSA